MAKPKGVRFIFHFFAFLFSILIFSGFLFNKNDSTIFEFFDDFRQNSTDEAEFDNKLLQSIKKSPVNSKTLRHQIILFVTNEGLLHFAKNSLCSLSHATDSTYLYVIVALDEVSYVSLKNFGANVLFYSSNFTHESVNYRQKIDFYNIVKIREHIAYKIINFGADAIISDVDIVYFANPLTLFTNMYDFEVQCDSRTAVEIPMEENGRVYWSVNLGFYKIAPSEANLKFIPIWEYQMQNMPESHDQATLWGLLRGKLIQLKDKDVLLADIRKFLREKKSVPLTIKYIDPMLAVNAGGAFVYNKNLWAYTAKQRNISKPVLCHFFHLSENTDKERLMKKKNLWYIDHQERCMKSPPKGHSWPWWD